MDLHAELANRLAYAVRDDLKLQDVNICVEETAILNNVAGKIVVIQSLCGSNHLMRSRNDILLGNQLWRIANDFEVDVKSFNCGLVPQRTLYLIITFRSCSLVPGAISSSAFLERHSWPTGAGTFAGRHFRVAHWMVGDGLTNCKRFELAVVAR